MKMVQAIRQGKLLTKPKEDPDARPNYDVWADNLTDVQDHVMTLRAPKCPLPPTTSPTTPAEYLPTEEEIAEWNALAPSERERNYVPKKYTALRHVPGYSESVRERFERSLDLYLAPRVRKNKLNIDPDSLIPDLPPQGSHAFPHQMCYHLQGPQGQGSSHLCGSQWRVPCHWRRRRNSSSLGSAHWSRAVPMSSGGVH